MLQDSLLMVEVSPVQAPAVAESQSKSHSSVRSRRTYQPATPTNRSWWVVDADGLTYGRLASEVARVLQGKHRPDFVPNRDIGDHIIVINAKLLHLTGHKAATKERFSHSGYPGGLTRQNFDEAFQSNPEEVFTDAIRGMLPKTKLGRRMIRKLRVYSGPIHPHEAQNPQPLELRHATRERRGVRNPPIQDSDYLELKSSADEREQGKVEHVPTPSHGRLIEEANRLLFPDSGSAFMDISDPEEIRVRSGKERLTLLTRLNRRLVEETDQSSDNQAE